MRKCVYGSYLRAEAIGQAAVRDANGAEGAPVPVPLDKKKCATLRFAGVTMAVGRTI